MKNSMKLICLLSGLLAFPALGVTDSYTTAGTYTWTAPAGVTSVTVETWGGGGAGGGATNNPAQGGGGAGGQYARKVVTVVSGNSYAVRVGAGGTTGNGNGGTGGDSTFNTNVVVAKGGAGGTGATNGVAGTGSTTGGVGTTVYAGGDGSNGDVSSGGCAAGAGGGGAGSGGSGGNASGTTAGAGGAVGGGDGGTGRTNSGSGNAGSAAGGGGGAGCAESNTNRNGGAGAAGRVDITYLSPPTVVTDAASPISATGATLNGTVSSNGSSTIVTFEYGTTTSYGSTITAAESPLPASASNASVSAVLSSLTCNTTYHFRVDATNSIGTSNGSDQTFTTSACPMACNPPSNIPPELVGKLTCQCDNFGRTTLNPSTIFGANWIVTTSDSTGIVPYINQTTGLLRLTENTGNNAKAATAPGIFPAAGNYISVEFQQYAYNGTGADGIAVTLSDYSVPPVPGAYGGSLGYAQKTGISGFAGGWVGVAMDEYGNYENGNEGRYGGISSSLYPQSVGVRGSGSGSTNSTPNYPWLRGATALSPGIDNRTSTTPSRGYYYQVIVDARNAGNPTPQTFVAVNRDITGGGSTNNYAQLIAPFDVFAANPNQAPVPANWQISFTGSTGGSYNIHEIGGLRICAQTMEPPSGGMASGFNAIDEAYARNDVNAVSGHLYTKLAGVPFTVKVAALNTGGTGILTTYAISSNKTVTVKLIDDSVGASCNASAAACSACSKPVVATQTMTFTAADTGFKQSGNFTVPAYSKLIAQMTDGTTTGCSVDNFAVRPSGFSAVASGNATNTGTSGTPIFKAGSGNFTLTATTTAITGNSGYDGGIPKINSAGVQVASPATVAGGISGSFGAATSGTGSATATGNSFTYSEVGGFYLRAPDFTLATPRIPGVYDDSWTAVDSGAKGDCIAGTSAAAYSNVKDANGKYGCNFGISANTGTFGRFVPDHFDTVVKYDKITKIYMPCPSGLSCALSGESPDWIYATSTARTNATGFVSSDIGKIAYDQDTATYWMLTAVSPTVQWVSSSFRTNGFVYSGQTFELQVFPRNAAGASTMNYVGTLAQQTGLEAWDALGSTTTKNPPSGSETLSGTPIPASAFQVQNGVVVAAATPAYTFASTATVPTNIYLRAIDADNVSSLRTVPAASIEGGVMVVSGRIKVSNAYGSQYLPLSLRATAQYYLSTGWVNSLTDNVTKLALTYGGTVTTTATLNPASGVLSGGNLSIGLAPPGAPGTVMAHAAVDPASPGNPVMQPIDGTATFGVYGGGTNYIYRRESY